MKILTVKLGVALVALGMSTQAAVWTWDNDSGDNNFTNAANWTSETSVHEFPAFETMVIELSGRETVVGHGGGTFTISNGEMEIINARSGASLLIGSENSSGSGTVHLSGGILTTASWDLITWPSSTTVTDGGLAFSGNVDLDKWSFQIADSALRITYGIGTEPEPEVVVRACRTSVPTSGKGSVRYFNIPSKILKYRTDPFASQKAAA